MRRRDAEDERFRGGGQAQADGELRNEIAQLEWDAEASADTVSASGSVVVAVKNGTPPYQWSVQGNDFSLADASTDGITNTLIAGPDACGTATVSVTDFCGDQAVGEVLSTNGTWGDPIAGCILPGEGSWWTPSVGYEIRGKYKQTQHITNLSGSNFDWAQCPTEKCDNACATSPACDPDFGCEPCLYVGQNEIPCTNAGYAGTDCPPACRAWCTCNTVLYYQEWVCP